jgi:hypothetical protein
VIFTFVAIALIDRVGRAAALVGSAGMFVTLAILTYVLPGAGMYPGDHRCWKSGGL